MCVLCIPSRAGLWAGIHGCPSMNSKAPWLLLRFDRHPRRCALVVQQLQHGLLQELQPAAARFGRGTKIDPRASVGELRTMPWTTS
jgi:hypothetical protein